METKHLCPSCHQPLSVDAPLGLCPECLLKAGFATGAESAASGPPAAGFVPPPVEEIARLFPQLEILEFIGKGGMGAVYKARQPALDRLVALKILAPRAASEAGFAERFNREARALARLCHPSIVAVHDFGQAGVLPYLLMEFVDGANLRQVEAAGRLAPEQALAIVPQICDALQFAHNEGIVHRDIKPENILLDKKGRVKITDFGIAKILGLPAGRTPLTGARDVVGTPHYMAPEQVEQPQTVDHRADIYSLGVVFYEMLTGQLPMGKFAAPSRKVQVDVRLDEVVLRALEQEPALRYQQASEMRTAVETIATTPPVQPAAAGGPTMSPQSAAAPPPSKAKWVYAFLVGFVAFQLLLCVSWLGSGAVNLGLVVMGIVLSSAAGAIAVPAYLLAKKGWLYPSLGGLAIVFLLWLGSALALTGQVLVGLPVGACALAGFVLIAKKGGLPRGLLAALTTTFLLVFGALAFVTAILPESFVSTARIKLTPIASETAGTGGPFGPFGAYDPYLIQTEFEFMQSRIILGKVMQELELSRKWSKRYGDGTPLDNRDTLAILKSGIALRPVRNTWLIEISVYSQQPDEAAAIANKIAEVYREYHIGSESAGSVSGAIRVELVEQAMPGRRPARPNKPINLAIGALLGLLAATIVGTAWAGRRAKRS